MSTSRTRIGNLTAVFLLAAAVVVGHLFVLMVKDHEVWAARSHENRWAFRSVPSLRGAIRDRSGRVLAHDEPTMQVSLFYQRFRLRHPVGAAVHGATAWARLHPGRELTCYDYSPGVLGAAAAARDLLAMPVAKLRRGVLDKGASAALLTSVTTVLSACSGMPRREVAAVLREAATARPAAACGDALPGCTTAGLLATYDGILAHLRWFDGAIASHLGPVESGLFARLEELRAASLAERRVRRTEVVDGEEVEGEGDYLENIAWPVAESVPFELAAGLRVGTLAHPGLLVRPAVRRQTVVPPGTSLRAWLGRVRDLGRLEHAGRNFETFAERELPEDWLDDIVPAQKDLGERERLRLQQDARQRFESLALRFERGGTSGFELAFDGELSGHLGLRLVERDSRQREHWMWSSLRVEVGADVTLTVDGELQRVAEEIVREAQAAEAAVHTTPEKRALTRAALAVIDARTGDVLALAGAPVSGSSSAGQVPGVVWSGNGSVGSVVKPFLLVEQLVCEATGRPHRPLREFEACSGRFDGYPGRPLGCDGKHWEEGRDPVGALAKSCNCFFYQVGVGLGVDGVGHALQRFGLMPPPSGSDLTDCWQGTVRGIPWSRPEVIGASLPTRAIGYGVQATPLAVARAYAGLATGRLPTLGTVAGEARKVVSLVGLEAELEVVREGLRGCVTYGTARHVTALAEYEVLGKTGTAEVGLRDHENNALFAGYVPWVARGGAQLCFCAVVYWVADGQHGAKAAGTMAGQLLQAVHATPLLRERYGR